MRLASGAVESLVCFSWTENGEEREFTAEDAPNFGAVGGELRALPLVGQTMSIWDRDVLVVSGTVESIATAYVEDQDLLNRWEAHVRLKVQE